MPDIKQEIFGVTADGQTVRRYTLTNAAGSSVSVLDYGGIVQRIRLNRAGELLDVCLGYDDIAAYERDTAYLGATIGRYANRIGGHFRLNGRTYPLDCNEGNNALHGGRGGFNRRLFAAEIHDGELMLSRVSPDGEEGFPGNLAVSVAFRWCDDNALELRYEAVSDADTVCNLTNHCYFNLNGAGSGTVLEHRLRIDAERYTEIGATLLPTGRNLPVDGTPFDFRTEKPIERDIAAEDEQLRFGSGYDHNFVVNEAGTLRAVARAFSPQSGIALSVSTDMPGLQFYSGNFLDTAGIGGRYALRGGFCLETQFYPDSPNQPAFPSATLAKGARYTKTTVYRFDV